MGRVMLTYIERNCVRIAFRWLANGVVCTNGDVCLVVASSIFHLSDIKLTMKHFKSANIGKHGFGFCTFCVVRSTSHSTFLMSQICSKTSINYTTYRESYSFFSRFNAERRLCCNHTRLFNPQVTVDHNLQSFLQEPYLAHISLIVKHLWL